MNRGTKIWITAGSLKGRTGTVEAKVFQKTVDSDDLAYGYHITLDDGTWVTVRRDQVMIRFPEHFRFEHKVKSTRQQNARGVWYFHQLPSGAGWCKE